MKRLEEKTGRGKMFKENGETKEENKRKTCERKVKTRKGKWKIREKRGREGRLTGKNNKGERI